METRQERAIDKLKTVTSCPLCGGDIVSTLNKEDLKHDAYRARINLPHKRIFVIKFECGGDLYVSDETFGFDIVASSQSEAIRRLQAMRFATYDGILRAKIPAELGWVARTFVFFGNLFGKSK